MLLLGIIAIVLVISLAVIETTRENTPEYRHKKAEELRKERKLYHKRKNKQKHCNHKWKEFTEESYERTGEFSGSWFCYLIRYCPECGKRERHWVN